jgi:hypothetical protein
MVAAVGVVCEQDGVDVVQTADIVNDN